jgi:hypothetical protein
MQKQTKMFLKKLESDWGVTHRETPIGRSKKILIDQQ